MSARLPSTVLAALALVVPSVGAQEADERASMSEMIPEPSRTPSGFLYAPPFVLPPARPFGADWMVRFSAEAGGIVRRGSDDAPHVRDARDFSGGIFLHRLDLGLEDRDGRYLDLAARGIARDDALFAATFGRLGDYRVRFTFNELAKIFTTRAQTVFHGTGSGTLVLPATLVPGGNTPAQLAAALAQASPFEIGFSRKRAGIELEATPGEHVQLYVRYAQERKKGTQPIGGAAGYPGVTTTELVEPIDHRTHEVLAGARWASDAVQANLSYGGSFFRNRIDTLTWDNPLVVDPFSAAVLQRGRLDLYPDNDAHNVRLDFGAALPLRGRVQGTLSWNRMTQDDPLVAPAVNSGILAGAPPVDLANWNTAAALSQASANARIDTRLARLSASFSPVADLSLQASLRRYDEDNRTSYRAFNPLTGQSGYLGLDGGVNFIEPSFLRAQIRSVPFAQRKDSAALEADWRVARRTNLVLAAERENVHRDYREVASTRENRFHAALKVRELSWATLRFSLEHAKRSGDRYDFDPYRQFYGGAPLLDAPPTLAELRKFDLAGRRQNVANARANFVLAPDMDLALSARMVTNDYEAEYGRLEDRTRFAGVDWNWQPRPEAAVYAHYGFARMTNRMASIADAPAGFGSPDASAGGPVYPLANRWQEASRDDSESFGIGARYAFARVTLETGFTHSQSRYRTQYAFASAGALAGGAAAAAGALDAMPDMLYRQQAIETSLRWRLDRGLALRLFHRYERVRVADWHYDELPLVFGGNDGVFLGAGRQAYSVHAIGFFVQYTPGKPD